MSALTGQRVIVTGAARGIGAAIARGLASDGARVLLADIQAERVSALAGDLAAEGFDVAWCEVDIADRMSAAAMVEACIRAFGGVDSLVNNAGIDAPLGKAWEIDSDHWDRLIAVNLSGAWWCTSAVLPHMMRQAHGRVVMISSLAARQGSEHHSPAYAAAKAGLLGLTVGLASQLDGLGILCNAITPGSTGDTGTPLLDAEREDLLRRFPLGAGGTAPIVDAVRYLLDGSGRWLSGVTLNVSGGQLRGI